MDVDALQEKHALELEEVQLKARKEALALRTKLMKADAKMQIYTFTQDQQSHYSKDTARSGTSTAFIPAATVQKTQRTQKPFSVPSPVSMALDTPTNVTSKVKLEGESLSQIPSQADVHSHNRDHEKAE
ncbi:hypothetical protein GOODEAATRI_017428 [Goodea atripinnis]|uniref:Uncharacterized protein n=1 Tax=Goodea atripinnis TaxID=208336 RepID=A0ABV0NVC5_9TELE